MINFFEKEKEDNREDLILAYYQEDGKRRTTLIILSRSVLIEKTHVDIDYIYIIKVKNKVKKLDKIKQYKIIDLVQIPHFEYNIKENLKYILKDNSGYFSNKTFNLKNIFELL